MSRYIVFEPPSEDVGPSEKARFVRDGFAGWAIFFPFLWLFRHGLWISGILVLIAWTGFGLLGEARGLGLTGAVLPILLGILVALEGPSLRAWRFSRKTFREVAVVEAGSEEEAAILYYAGTVSRESQLDSRETLVAPPFIGRPEGSARSLLDLPRTSI